MKISLILISLFNNLFILFWTQGYLFYSLKSNTIIFYYIVWIVPDVLIKGSSSWPLRTFDMPYFHIFFSLSPWLHPFHPPSLLPSFSFLHSFFLSIASVLPSSLPLPLPYFLSFWHFFSGNIRFFRTIFVFFLS